MGKNMLGGRDWMLVALILVGAAALITALSM